jgi:hypothetical protein
VAKKSVQLPVKRRPLFGGLCSVTGRKILATLLILFLLTPLASIFLYPQYAGGAASGAAYWKNRMSWGVYPYVFMGLREFCVYPCDFRHGATCPAACSDNLVYEIYGVLTGGGHYSGPLSFPTGSTGYAYGIPVPSDVEFVLDLLISFAICYALVSMVSFAYGKLKHR